MKNHSKKRSENFSTGMQGSNGGVMESKHQQSKDLLNAQNNDTKEKALRIQWILSEYNLTRPDIQDYLKNIIELLSAPRGSFTRNIQRKVDAVDSHKSKTQKEQDDERMKTFINRFRNTTEPKSVKLLDLSNC